jgi:acetyltransferase-like isoleucine patch superfamily enzyme
MKKIFYYLLSYQQPVWRVYARWRRANVHPSVVMNGRPLIRCARGAQLVLHSGVQINTSIASNPVIGRCRSSLSAVAAGARLIVEEDVGASGVCITAAKEVVIGSKTFLGADCLITDTDFHLPDGKGGWRNDAASSARPVHIGKGCFLGARCIILKGVTIGDGAVIGAGAVVTRDVPAEHLAIGNPATVTPLPGKWRQSVVAALIP